MPFMSRVPVKEHPHRGRLFLTAQEGTQEAESNIRAWLGTSEQASDFTSAHVQWQRQVTWLGSKSREGGSKIPTANPGQDKGGKDELGSTHPIQHTVDYAGRAGHAVM